MEFKQEELSGIVELFHKLGLQPKAEKPEDLKTWIQDMAKQEGPLQPSKLSAPPEPLGDESQVTAKSHVTASATASANPPYPKLPTFSGDLHGKDATFDLWTYEVDCLQQLSVYSAAVLEQAIRHSLKGEAARVAMCLGPKATIQDLLRKLQSIYGTVQRKEALMAQFYSAAQRDEEDVASWGCRLEHLLSKVTEHHDIPPLEQDEMLRNMLWSGLRRSLKSVSGHKFDSVSSFDELRIALREIVYDLRQGREPAPSSRKQSASAKMATPSETITKSDLDTLTTAIHQLRTEVTEIKERQQQPAHVFQHQASFLPQTQGYGPRHKHRGRGRGKDYGCNQPQLPPHGYGPPHKYSSSGAYPYPVPQGPQDAQAQTQVQQPQVQTPLPQESQGTFTHSGPQGYGYEQEQLASYPTPPQRRQNDVVCYRCGYTGHIAIGCQV
ncbi:uncharacterized protein LOC124274986 [Haliotis rubra]|uniref:uncharacterized protein LOC124274986 n=1 Tax=Haliotis rubra TaxID=36100 RepID=UPI001EE508B0|nr:uncharacterized protein LOC124274986 [Haliotis rubra]